MGSIDIAQSHPEKIFSLTFDDQDRPVPFATSSALQIIERSGTTLKRIRTETMAMLDLADGAREMLEQAEELLVERCEPFVYLRWPFDEDWRERILGLYGKREKGELEKADREKKGLLEELNQLKRDKAESQAELENLREETKRMEAEKERLINGLRVFQ